MRGIPVQGVCEECHLEFSADPRSLGQSGIQQQFNQHKCAPESVKAPSAAAAKASGKK